MPVKFAYKSARRIAAIVIGFTMLALGIALLVLPGPGILVASAGLMVLGLEFAWARRWLSKVRHGISDAARRQRLRRLER